MLKKLNIARVDNTKGNININPNLVQELIILDKGPKFIINLTLVSGRTYQLADDLGKYEFDTLAEATGLIENLFNGVNSNEEGGW